MNYISLGHFCSVALELEKYGLRRESSPFDWLICDFEGVIRAMKEHFADFLAEEYLSQNKKNGTIYKNTKYQFSFYHDFDKYTPLREQLPGVEKKYARRIQRFYKTITRPTCFVRYLSDETSGDGRVRELTYIEENYKEILAFFKSFHPDNQILFIGNDGLSSEKFKIYNVAKDPKDTVARAPFAKNPELLAFFSGAAAPNKEENRKRYRRKARKQPFLRLKRKIISLFQRIFRQEYVHPRQF